MPRQFGSPPKEPSADAVLADANRLRVRLGAGDKQRLDAHLEHIRSLQRRIDAESPECVIPQRPGNSGDLKEKTRIMAELLAVGLNCGLTRSFSFMLTSPASTHVFSNLGVPDGMHKTCHDGHWDRVRRITEYQMDVFATPDAPKRRTLPAAHCLSEAACTAPRNTVKGGGTAQRAPCDYRWLCRWSCEYRASFVSLEAIWHELT